MKGYTGNIEKETEQNDKFRKVLYTAKNSQLALMNIEAGEEIGEEIHDLDQFICVKKGRGRALLNGEEQSVAEGWAVVVPAGARHNIINDGEEDLKLYTVYSPPEHRDGVIHETREEAMEDEEHFDGNTTE